MTSFVTASMDGLTRQGGWKAGQALKKLGGGGGGDGGGGGAAPPPPSPHTGPKHDPHNPSLLQA